MRLAAYQFAVCGDIDHKDPGSYVTAYVENGKAVMKEANHGWSGNQHYRSPDIDLPCAIKRKQSNES